VVLRLHLLFEILLVTVALRASGRLSGIASPSIIILLLIFFTVTTFPSIMTIDSLYNKLSDDVSSSVTPVKLIVYPVFGTTVKVKSVCSRMDEGLLLGLGVVIVA